MDSMSPYTIITSYLPGLTAGEKKIAQFMLDHYNAITKLNIGELAEKIEVSESSIIRFTRKIGYSGFRRFKLEVAAWPIDQSMDYFEDIKVQQLTFGNTLRTYLTDNIATIEKNLNELNFSELEKLAELIMEKKSLYFGGEYMSGSLAHGAFLRFKTLFKDVYFVNDKHSVIQESYWITDQDLVILVSQRGRASNTLAFCRNAQEKGATVVAFTANIDSELYKIADYKIVPHSPYNNVETRYINTELVIKLIFDALYIHIERLKKDKDKDYTLMYDREWML